MTIKTLLLTASIGTVFFAPATQAQITAGWSGEASLSGSSTSGNTETTDIGLALNLAKEDGPWKNNFLASYDLGDVDGEKNKDRLFLGYELERLINDRLFAYGNANYFNDDFGSFRTGYFVGGGLGYKVLVDAPFRWDVKGGPGFRSQTEQDIAGVDGQKVEEFAVRGASAFDWAINDNVSLFNNSEVIWSDSDTYVWNDIGITATLAGNLAARASFRVDHHTDAPLGTENTDTITRFGIVYTMK